MRVSLQYMAMHGGSLGFIYVCPYMVLAHWVYLIGAAVVLEPSVIFEVKDGR